MDGAGTALRHKKRCKAAVKQKHCQRKKVRCTSSACFAVVHTICSGESCAASASINQLVACLAKTVIPLLDKLANKVAEIDGRKWPRIGDVRPGMDSGPSVGLGLKGDPLLHCVAQHMVNPGNLPPRRANGNYMIYRCFPRTDDFNFKPASRLPGFSLAPADFSIDVRKAWPKAIIAKHVPGKRGAGLGKDCVLQILHLLLLPRTRNSNEEDGEPRKLNRQGKPRGTIVTTLPAER